MRKIMLASVAVLALAGTTAVYARHGGPGHHHHTRMNPEDRAAFADAKIAAVKAGLKLTPDQEKLWPPVEAAARDFAKLRIDRANARMDERRNDRSDRGDDARRSETPDNPVARLQKRADDMAATAAALKKIAETADPLYRTLDDGQKRRLSVLTRMDGGPHGEFRHHRGKHFFDRDEDRGPDRDRPRRFERDRGAGPERL